MGCAWCSPAGSNGDHAQAAQAGVGALGTLGAVERQTIETDLGRLDAQIGIGTGATLEDGARLALEGGEIGANPDIGLGR